MDTFKNRLLKALEMNDMRAVDLSNKTGISKGRISQYMSGLYEPKPKALYEICKALNVNESWLMGYDELPQYEKATQADYDDWDSKYTPNGELTLSVKIAEMYGNNTAIAVDKFIKLDNTDQEKVIERMDTMLEADKYKK